MDSTFLLPSVFWLLVFLVAFLLIVVGGIVALFLMGMYSQSTKNTVPGRNDNVADVPGKVEKHKKVIGAMVGASDNLVTGFNARFTLELQQRGITQYNENDL